MVTGDSWTYATIRSSVTTGGVRPRSSRRYPGLLINDIISRISADFGIVVDFTRPTALTSLPRPELGSTVVFVMDTDGATKRWPASRWLALASELGAARARRARPQP